MKLTKDNWVSVKTINKLTAPFERDKYPLSIDWKECLAAGTKSKGDENPAPKDEIFYIIELPNGDIKTFPMPLPNIENTSCFTVNTNDIFWFYKEQKEIFNKVYNDYFNKTK